MFDTTIAYTNANVGGAQKLAEVLKDNTVISVLNLGYNAISDVGAKEIASAVAANNTLISLDLSIACPDRVGKNYIGIEGAKEIAAAIGRNKALLVLNLSVFA